MLSSHLGLSSSLKQTEKAPLSPLESPGCTPPRPWSQTSAQQSLFVTVYYALLVPSLPVRTPTPEM